MRTDLDQGNADNLRRTQVGAAFKRAEIHCRDPDCNSGTVESDFRAKSGYKSILNVARKRLAHPGHHSPVIQYDRPELNDVADANSTQ